MKNYKLFPMFLLLLLYSCNSQTKNKVEKEMAKSTFSKPFDLANLTLNENINDILTFVNLSPKDTIKNEELTLMGNERFVFNSENVLIFNKIKLTNKSNNDTNNIIFHYGKIDPEIGALNNEKNNILGMYQINIYSENEIKYLLQNLNLKLGKEFFEKEIEGNTSDIKDNNLIETKNKFKENISIWKKNNLIYYCFIKYTLNDKKEYKNSLNLFVFNKSNKEWIGFISGLGYQFTEKCLDK
jgi:hypothetical protein